MSNPPDDLKGMILTKKLKKEIAINYLKTELNKLLPDIEEIKKDINLYCDFKDVTFEMLKDKDFQMNVRKQSPHLEWPTPVEEYEAI